MDSLKRSQAHCFPHKVVCRNCYRLSRDRLAGLPGSSNTRHQLFVSPISPSISEKLTVRSIPRINFGHTSFQGIPESGYPIVICYPNEMDHIQDKMGQNCPPLHQTSELFLQDKTGSPQSPLKMCAGTILFCRRFNPNHRY